MSFRRSLFRCLMACSVGGAHGCQAREADPDPIPPPDIVLQTQADTCPLHAEASPVVVDVAANESRLMIVRSDGRALCWGPDEGGCGAFFVFPYTHGYPRRVRASDCVSKIYPGSGGVSAAHLWDGSFVVWGVEINDTADAGDGPLRGPGLGVATRIDLPEVTGVSLDGWGGLAVTAEGDLYFWGHSGAGETWDTPRKYPAPGRVVQGEVDQAKCFVVEDGRVYCFGPNDDGTLGPDIPVEGTFDPVLIDLPGPAAKVEVASVAVCAQLLDGSVWCWGKNDGGIFGVPWEELPGSASPLRIEGLPPAADLHAEGYGACVIAADGQVTCWGGAGAYGGQGFSTVSPKPWFPEHQVADLAVMTEFVCALLTDGRVFCSGGPPGSGGGGGFVDVDKLMELTVARDACEAAGSFYGIVNISGRCDGSYY